MFRRDNRVVDPSASLYYGLSWAELGTPRVERTDHQVIDDHHSRADVFKYSYGEADDHCKADLTVTKSTERLTAAYVAVTG